MNSIVDEKTVYVAYSNTDCTEGRGSDIPVAVCELEETAKRLAHKRYIQGSDGPVRPAVLRRIGAEWYAPEACYRVISPTKEDRAVQKMIDAKRAALDKAKAAGLSDEDIAALL
jgi:hypothetical protein